MEKSPLPDSINNGIEWVVGFRRRIRSRRRKANDSRARQAAMKGFLDLMNKNAVSGRIFEPTWNICLYLLLIDQDLAELTNDMVCAIGPKRRKYVARNLAVLLWEASDDLSQLLSNDYRRSLDKFELPADWIAELNASVSRLGAFKRANRDLLTNIRNMVAAHREKNAIEQHRMMQEIDALEIARLGPEYQASVDTLVPLMMKIMSHPKATQVAVNDYLHNFQMPVNDEAV